MQTVVTLCVITGTCHKNASCSVVQSPRRGTFNINTVQCNGTRIPLCSIRTSHDDTPKYCTNKSTIQSMTQLPTTSTPSTTTNTTITTLAPETHADNSTVKTTHGEYFINYKKLNHSAAVEECQTDHSGSLITTGSITAYFNTLIQLQLKYGTYWIDGNTGNDTGCVRYDKHTGGIYPAQCDETYFSICGCKTLFSVEDILEDPEFKKLIADMTVNKSTTFRAKSKLQSLADHRPSAKVVGTVGIIVMVVVGLFVVLIDFINLIKSCKKSNIQIEPVQNRKRVKNK